MARKHVILHEVFNLGRMLTLAVICLTTVSDVFTTPRHFSCHGDFCNVKRSDQFCSDIYMQCRSCYEIVDDCLTAQMPLNCSKTCIEFLVQQRVDAKGESTCKRLPVIYNGAWTNNSSVFNISQTVQAICQDGYELRGSSLWICSISGWMSLEEDQELPFCEKKIWQMLWLVIGLAIALAVCLIVLLILCIKGVFKGKCRNKSFHKSPNPEEIKAFIPKPEAAAKSDSLCLDFQEQASEKRKSDLLERTISLEEEKKSRGHIPNKSTRNLEIQSKESAEQPLKVEKSSQNGITINIHNSQSFIPNVITNNKSDDPTDVTTKDPSADSAETDEEAELLENTKMSQEESATFDQRQPVDSVVHPTDSDDVGKAKTISLSHRKSQSMNAAIDNNGKDVLSNSTELGELKSVVPNDNVISERL